MVDATIMMTVPRGKRQEVLQTVRVILASIRREQGCISCHYYMDVEDESVFCLKEQWDSRENLDNHFRSERFGVLIGAMSLLNAEPEIRINMIESTAGIEAVKAHWP